jgi:hypothetical protein
MFSYSIERACSPCYCLRVIGMEISVGVGLIGILLKGIYKFLYVWFIIICQLPSINL